MFIDKITGYSTIKYFSRTFDMIINNDSEAIDTLIYLTQI